MLRRAPVKKLSTQMTLAPPCQQLLAEVGADEAGAAGYQHARFKVHAIVSVAIGRAPRAMPRMTQYLRR